MQPISEFKYDQQEVDHLVDVTLNKLCAKFSDPDSTIENHIQVAMAEVQLFTQAIVGEREVAQEIIVLMQAAGLALGLPIYEMGADGNINEITVLEKSNWWNRKRMILDQFVKDISNLIHYMEDNHG